MKTSESFGGFSTWGMRGQRVPGQMKFFCGANLALGMLPALGLRDAFADGWGYGVFELSWVLMFFGIALYAGVSVWEKRGR